MQGRSEELTRWEDYPPFAIRWRDEVANVRVHQSTKQRPVDRFQEERGLLRPLPVTAFDTDQVVSVVVSSHARVCFDGNRYSAPPQTARKTLLLRASDSLVRVLEQDLAELRLMEIAATYREVLDEAARENSSMLDVLASLIASEISVRRQRALERRIRQAKLPPRKTLEDYDFTFPKRIPKQKVLRLFDCEFVAQHHCAVLIGRTGVGKSHLLSALGYTACEKGISTRWTRVIDMINALTKAQLNGSLETKLKEYVRPELLLLDELGYLPVDKRGADLMFQVVAARYESGSIVITTNRAFREWGKIFDVDNTLATAMIDRLMHHGEALVIEGRSHRNPESDEASP